MYVMFEAREQPQTAVDGVGVDEPPKRDCSRLWCADVGFTVEADRFPPCVRSKIDVGKIRAVPAAISAGGLRRN